MPTKSNDTVVTQTLQRIQGIEKYLKHEKVLIPFKGALLKPRAFQAVLQKCVDARADVVSTQAAYRAAVKRRDDLEADRAVAEATLRGWILARYGSGSTEANELGYAAPKAPYLSAEDRAVAVEKSRATRLARGTMGKKAKLAIRGVVPAASTPDGSDSTAPPRQFP